MMKYICQQPFFKDKKEETSFTQTEMITNMQYHWQIKTWDEKVIYEINTLPKSLCVFDKKGRQNVPTLDFLFLSAHFCVLCCTRHMSSLYCLGTKAGQRGPREEDEEKRQQHGLEGLQQTLPAKLYYG